MGEVVELPAGRKRNRQVQKIRTVATKDRAANGKQPSFLARAASVSYTHLTLPTKA